MIHDITNLFNRAGVLVESRPAVARVIARVIFGISSYAHDRKSLLNVRSRNQAPLSEHTERQVWSWMRQISWSWEINTCYWRALGAFIETQDLTQAAHQHNITQQDFAYLFSQLNDADIRAFVDQGRNWRAPTIDNRTISDIIKQLKPSIRACVHKLRFVWQHDPSSDEADWSSYFTCEALQTLYKYEDRHTLTHLVNTVRVALTNKCGIMQSRYSTVKQGMLVNVERFETKRTGHQVKSKKTENQLSLDRSPYVARRAPIMITGGEDGGEMENLELASRSIKPEPAIDTTLFIQQVERKSEVLARYLKLVAVEEEDEEFNAWLDEHELPTSSFTELRNCAAKFLGMTRNDFAALRQIADEDFTIGRQLEARSVAQKLRDMRSAHRTSVNHNSQPRAVVGGRHK
jgi:hypothetical protein